MTQACPQAWQGVGLLRELSPQGCHPGSHWTDFRPEGGVLPTGLLQKNHPALEKSQGFWWGLWRGRLEHPRMCIRALILKMVNALVLQITPTSGYLLEFRPMLVVFCSGLMLLGLY